MIRISQLKLKVGHTREQLFEEIIHQAHGKRPVSWQIVRKSVDARKKPQLFYVYTIDAEFENEKKLLSAKKSNGQNHLFQTIPFHIVIVKKQECLSKKKNWKNDQ